MQADLVRQFTTWQSGVAHELGFWRAIISARGGPYAIDFNYRIDPDGGMDWLIGREIITSPIAKARILDVGSGPLTKIGKVYGGERPKIVATDPLAPFYLKILDEYEVRPPVRVQQAFAEDLSCYFATESFDVTVCINALDHSFTPVRALTEMVDVTKMGGAIFLQHRINEASNENYAGFHQWNIEARNGKAVLWNRDTEIDIQSALLNGATVSSIDSVDGIVTIVLRRTGHLGCHDPARHRGRIAEILSVMAAIAAARGHY
jgi:SAM-dependent methyltransferase